MIRWLAMLLVVGAVVHAHADTGGSMGGGNWTPTRVPTTPSQPSTFGGIDVPTYTPPSIPTYTPPPIPTYTPPHDEPLAVGSGVGSAFGPPVFDDSPLPREDEDWMFKAFPFLFAGVVLFIAGAWIKELLPSRLDRAIAHADDTDVSVLRIALDGRARPFVQRELTRIASTADTATDDGRVTLLREVTMLVRRLRDAWVYGGAENEPMRGLLDSRVAFSHHVDEAREKFFEETIRNEDGAKTGTAPSSYTPHSEEGAGLILVSIILAARRELFTVKKIGNGDDLRRALEAAGHLDTDSLVAVEIVWQPSQDADRLSSMELEAKYPAPALVPIANALVGKTFCAYCGGPYPAELVSCPHCGAPAKKEAA